MFFRIFSLLILISSIFYSPPVPACHEEDCPHTSSETGIHWQKSLRISYRSTEFNLLPTHENMSKRVERRESSEPDMNFLNLAMCNLQFIYEKQNRTLALSQPHEIKGSDDEGKDKPFFSNLNTTQLTNKKYVKFPEKPMNVARFNNAHKIVSAIRKIPLNTYQEQANLLNEIRSTIIENVQSELNKDLGKKRKRTFEKNKEFYKEFLDRLEVNNITAAKRAYKKITSEDTSLRQETKTSVDVFFSDYEKVRQDLRKDIQNIIKTRNLTLIIQHMFNDQEIQDILINIDKKRSIFSYITETNKLLNIFEQKLDEETELLNASHAGFAWRRLQALKEDFEEDTYLPFNRKDMLMNLKSEKDKHFQHSEQLILQYINLNFQEIKEELHRFFVRNSLLDKKIHGVIFNLFSTRDICDRCAVCVTIDHAHKDGFAAKLMRTVKNHNKKWDFDKAPFVAYAISSRFSYKTPIGNEVIDTREYCKSVDAFSNTEEARNLADLSKTHISIQTYFFSHTNEEFTEKEIKALNQKMKKIKESNQ